MFVVQAAWPERYDAASTTVQALQQRLEETKHSSREKDATVTKLKNRLHQLEEAVQNACKEVDEKDARLKKEHEMLEDVSGADPLHFSYAVIFGQKGQCDVHCFFCSSSTSMIHWEGSTRERRWEMFYLTSWYT